MSKIPGRFSRHHSQEPQNAPAEDAFGDGFDDDFDDGFDDIQSPQPETAVLPAQSAPEADPAKPAAEQTVPASEPVRPVPGDERGIPVTYDADRFAGSDIGGEAEEERHYQKRGGVFDRVKDKITGEAGDGYVPKTGGELVRLRYRRRNVTPWPMWVKAALTVSALTAFFGLVLFLTFHGMITGRVFNTTESHHNTVRLTVNEQQLLYASETEEQEDISTFTAPSYTADPQEGVNVILVVSSSNDLGTQRSALCDAMMLLVIDENREKIKLISILGDTYARIPGYYSNKISKAFYYDTALGDYSLPTTMQAIEDNFGIIPDDYLVVSFGALQTIVNRLGGVAMTLTDQEAAYMRSDPKYGLFPRFTNGGEYVLSGAEALNYIRMVKVGDGDYQRTQRQRAVLFELISKFKKAAKGETTDDQTTSTLVTAKSKMGFMRLSETVYAILPTLPTSMTGKDIWHYFLNSKTIAAYEVEQMTVPINGSWRYGEGDEFGNKYSTIVTNFTFNSEVLRDYIYEDDSTYIGGAFASDVIIPDTIAPLPEVEEVPGETQEEVQEP